MSIVFDKASDLVNFLSVSDELDVEKAIDEFSLQ